MPSVYQTSTHSLDHGAQAVGITITNSHAVRYSNFQPDSVENRTIAYSKELALVLVSFGVIVQTEVVFVPSGPIHPVFQLLHLSQ